MIPDHQDQKASPSPQDQPHFAPQGERPEPSLAKRRPRGKIARLPTATRDRLNNMMRDGMPYAEITSALGDEGRHLSERNLSDWKDGGYQHWLAHQEWLEDTRAHQDHALHLLRDTDAAQLQELSLQVATTRIYDLLRHLDPASLAKDLQADPQSCTRIFAVLPRITREALRFQKYRDAILSARKQLQSVLDPAAELSEAQRRAIIRHVDETLGVSIRNDTPRDPEPPYHDATTPVTQSAATNPGPSK